MAIDDATDFDIISIEMVAEGELDKTTGLSNGDTVKYVMHISDESAKAMNKKLGVKLKYKDLSKKVEGLKDPKDSDAGIKESDIGGYDHYSDCSINDKLYAGSASIDELIANTEQYVEGGTLVVKEL